jgi:ribose 5-phosphate isomerase A
VESAADRLIIVVDESKLVDRLGDKAPVPIEVVPFGADTHLKFLEDLGGQATFRMAGREKFITDSKHYIIDCAFEDGIADPWVLETELQQRAGVVESGLFLDMAEAVVVASAGGIRVMDRGDQ